MGFFNIQANKTMSEPSPDPMHLAGRHVVVTGAGQGIGRAISELVLVLGGSVTLVDVSAGTLAETAKPMPVDRVLTRAGSVTDAGFVASVFEDAVARFGAVDGLVNNAGIVRPAMIHKMTRDQWDSVLDVNLTGAFHCLQEAGRHMVAAAKAGRRPGAVVNVSADAGRKGSVGQINYSASKAAMLGMTMSAAQEWGRFGVRVNSVCFGVVETPMTETIRGERFRDIYLSRTPLGRFATADEVAKPVAFLLSDAASYVTGQHLSVNGGAFMSA